MAIDKNLTEQIKIINQMTDSSKRSDHIGFIIDSNNPYDQYLCKTKGEFSKRHGILAHLLTAIDDKSTVMTKIQRHTGIVAEDVPALQKKLNDIQKDTKPTIWDQTSRMLYGAVRHLPFTKPLQKILLKGADVVWSKIGYGRVTLEKGGMQPMQHPDFSSDRQRDRKDKIAQQMQNGLIESPDMASPDCVVDGRHRITVAQDLGVPVVAVQIGRKP